MRILISLIEFSLPGNESRRENRAVVLSFFLSFFFDDIIGRLELSFVAQFLTYINCEISLVVFMPIITTKRAITDPYLCSQIIYKRK